MYEKKIFHFGIMHQFYQSPNGIRQFRSHLYLLHKLDDNKKNKLIAFVRDLSNNNVPLVLGLKHLLDRSHLNYLHTVAVEEGFLHLFANIIFTKSKFSYSEFNLSCIFEHSR